MTKAKRSSRFRIEAWNQPEGRGYGWAKCSDKRAEKFFVFDKDGTRLQREFTTRIAAREYLKDQGLRAPRQEGCSDDQAR